MTLAKTLLDQATGVMFRESHINTLCKQLMEVCAKAAKGGLFRVEAEVYSAFTFSPYDTKFFITDSDVMIVCKFFADNGFEVKHLFKADDKLRLAISWENAT